MSTFTERSGGAARIRITRIVQGPPPGGDLAGPSFYNIKKWRISDAAEKGDTTNTESQLDPNGVAVAREQIAVARQVTVSISSASYDPLNNFFSVPLPIFVGGYIKLEIFPNGILASTPYLFPILWVEKRDWEGEAGGLQPFTLEGLSNGTWTEPTP